MTDAAAPNPYAPPRAGAALPAPGPLPEGVRRCPLDPARHRAFVQARLVRLALTIGAVALPVAGLMYWSGSEFVAGGYLLGAILMVGVLVLQVRRMHVRAAATYELLVGPRAIRRTIATLPPGELLRPEITGGFETRLGLWLESHDRALFFSCALVDYEELKAALSAGRTIERVSGWSAWRRGTAASKRQGARDVVAGTLLASDPSLAVELEELRHASSTAWMAYPQRKRNPVRILILWVLLVVMFIALWQFLAPDERPRPRPRSFPTEPRP